jgi:hypothetical protein
MELKRKSKNQKSKFKGKQLKNYEFQRSEIRTKTKIENWRA